MNTKRIVQITATVICVLLLCMTATACSMFRQKEDTTFSPPAITAFYIDAALVHRAMEVVLYTAQNESASTDDLLTSLKVIQDAMQNASSYALHANRLSTRKQNVTYGAINDPQNPIGGGTGYVSTIISGDYHVRDADELIAAIEKAVYGEVIFIESDAVIDLTSMLYAENRTLYLRDGVTLASDRGHAGSQGGMILSDAIRSRPLFEMGSQVTLSGLTIKGPDPHMREYPRPTRATGISIEKDSFTMENCEISGFGYAALWFKAGQAHRVTNSVIHHNRSPQGGYGLKIEHAHVYISHTLFNANRISVYGTGGSDLLVHMEHNVEMGTNHEHPVKIDVSRNSLQQEVVLHMQHNSFLTTTPPFLFHGVAQVNANIAYNRFSQSEQQIMERMTTDATGDNNAIPDLSKNLFDFEKQPEGLDQTLEDLVAKFTVDMMSTPVTARLFYGDLVKVDRLIRSLIARGTLVTFEDMIETLEKALIVLEQYERAYDYLEQPYVEKDGVIYGIIKDDNPLGGGVGYGDVFTDGDYVVRTLDELVEALDQAKAGEVVFVPGDAVIDLTTRPSPLVIPEGVTLASDRGSGTSTGALIFSDIFSSPMFVAQKDVRITGIVLKGADPKWHYDHHYRSFFIQDAPGHEYFYRLRVINGILANASNLTVDNCELSGFSHAAIFIRRGTGHRISHNFIHHNQRRGLGYGITHDTSYSIIEYNLFNFNRHSIAATGAPGSGYTARHNMEMGDAKSHNFDVHGGSSRGDGTQIAGERVIMAHNLFLSERLPYLIRGIPTDIQDFHHNVIGYPLEAFNRVQLYGRTDEERDKFVVRDNIWNLFDDPELIP